MVQKIFFQSSMPRSGSTLFQNIMAQNPDFYTTPTSGLCDMLLNAKSNYTNSIEFKAQDSKLMDKGFKGFCKNALFGFYDGITEKKYVLDKCRGWSVTYDFVNWFYPEPKIIILVRDLRSIVSSLEKKFRENQHLDTGIQSWSEMRGTTVDKRIDHFMTVAPPLCAPIDIIYDVIIRKIHTKCLFIRFEDLCNNPEAEMQRVYKYLEIDYYKHDFDNIPQATIENDSYYRPFGDHSIRNVLEKTKDDYNIILGKHNCKYITDKYSWYYQAFNYPT